MPRMQNLASPWRTLRCRTSEQRTTSCAASVQRHENRFREAAVLASGDAICSGERRHSTTVVVGAEGQSDASIAAGFGGLVKPIRNALREKTAVQPTEAES